MRGVDNKSVLKSVEVVPLVSWTARRGSDGEWAGYPVVRRTGSRKMVGGQLEVGVVKGRGDIEASRRK